MTQFEEADPYSCCADAHLKEQFRENGDGAIYVYSRCKNCDAQWREVFLFNRAEREVNDEEPEE